MPTVLRISGYTFYFWSDEGVEPAHIHVRRGGDYAKFWLESVKLVQHYGFRRSELTILKRMVEQHRAELLEAWYAYFA
ncbi:MAG: DUF4160 domain-containing protein [Gemmatimonadaceae bacterium]